MWFNSIKIILNLNDNIELYYSLCDLIVILNSKRKNEKNTQEKPPKIVKQRN